MSSLQILQGTFRLGDTKTLQLHQLMLNAGDGWAFVGSNGSGKSALARALAGELPLLKGERQSLFSHITRLSFEQLQKLISDEWQRNNTDMLGPDEDDTGRTTAEIIQDTVKDAERCRQLAHSEQLDGVQLPESDEPSARHGLPASEPRIVLNNGVVSYNDRPILNNLSWQVNPGEHWQIVGPNGAGKSTLLSLITGDHPQGYSNDLTLFGRRRGSGETIWDIKKHIGYVSSNLHLDYRVSTTVRNVILSGYFDSIGIYQAVSDRQQKLVQQWLDILGINKRTADAPFHSLSWGQQRLALIVRALVKHPTLLILDEPLQGLDPLNRQLIRRFVDVLISEGETQLLFVSHHAEDAPACITHRLEFVPNGDNYRYALTKIN
ncbi:molybdate ABC transporter ATP-binding protein ModF [Escherichia albertii]|uniref:molybdate ABC transporter ATP-binding protein ModF n=1 Tax=Escherichia albertii TaxID=208962 RepID=UPI00074438B8|nr:molybdate ABC transporter ATP-binding protein ModF [Escherichia albertii]